MGRKNIDVGTIESIVVQGTTSGQGNFLTATEVSFEAIKDNSWENATSSRYALHSSLLKFSNTVSKFNIMLDKIAEEFKEVDSSLAVNITEATPSTSGKTTSGKTTSWKSASEKSAGVSGKSAKAKNGAYEEAQRNARIM